MFIRTPEYLRGLNRRPDQLTVISLCKKPPIGNRRLPTCFRWLECQPPETKTQNNFRVEKLAEPVDVARPKLARPGEAPPKEQPE